MTDNLPTDPPDRSLSMDELREALRKAIHAVYVDHGQTWIGPDDAEAILAKMTEHKLAALAQTPDAGLDVERLRRAIHADVSQEDCDGTCERAEAIAAEYARLREALP